MRGDLLQREFGEELERRQRQRTLETRQHFQNVGEVFDAEHHHHLRRRHFREPHLRFDDETERAFGADEQMTQVVAGRVLHETVIQVEHRAGAGDHFQSGDPVARETVADHADAAGVRRDVAADLARTGRREVDRIEQTALRRVILQRFGDDARLTPHDAVGFVEIEDAVHAIERHDDLAVRCNRAARQSRSCRPTARATNGRSFAARTSATTSSTLSGNTMADGATAKLRVQSRPHDRQRFRVGAHALR